MLTQIQRDLRMRGVGGRLELEAESDGAQSPGQKGLRGKGVDDAQRAAMHAG